MKRMKKIFAVILSLAMVMGMSLTAFADDVVGTESDNGEQTLKVTGVEDGATVKAYKIIEAEYNNVINGVKYFSNYKSLYSDLTITNGSNITIDETTLQKITTAMDFKNGFPTKLAAGTSALDLTGNKTNGYSISTADVGSYLIVVQGSGSDTTIYSPTVVSVEYLNNNGTFSINTEKSTAAVKHSSKPGVTKTAKKDGKDVKSVNIGDTIDYEVVVNPIPYYAGSFPVFSIEDTLGTGLTLTKTNDVVNIKVFLENAEITDISKIGTLTTTDTSFKIDFVKNNVFLLNEYQGKALKVQYSATVTDKNAINIDPYTNTATLKYTNNPNINKGNNPNKEESKTYNYTFDLSATATGSKTDSALTKTGEKDSSNQVVKLPNAEFTLYTDASCSENSKYTINTLIPNGVVTSGSNGQLVIRGLAAGNYWLKETKAPAGYSLNEKAYPIVITAHYYGDEGYNAPDDALIGQLCAWEITFDSKPIITGKDVVFDTETKKPTNATVTGPTGENGNIPNTKLSSLPSTGGIGTTIFTIGGCAIMIIAAALFFASRRKEAK